MVSSRTSSVGGMGLSIDAGDGTSDLATESIFSGVATAEVSPNGGLLFRSSSVGVTGGSSASC